LALGSLAGLLLCAVEPVLHWAGVAPALIPKRGSYIRAVALGFRAIALYQPLRGMTDGLSRTKPAMVMGFLVLSLTAPANYGLVGGKLGVPAMGGVGCGVASTLVMWSMRACMVLRLNRASLSRASGRLERFEWPNWRAQRSLPGLGL